MALDFNANNRDDLAIGIPYEDFGALTNNGAVNVIFGAAGGLNAAGNSVTWQDAAGVLDVAESSDIFGYSLTAGDFNGDNRDDLGVGVPYEDVGAIVNAGAVNVLYNLFAGGNQFFTQNTAGVLDVAEANDLFGYSLAVGDFNNNGRDDLVVGVPFENLGASSTPAVSMYSTARWAPVANSSGGRTRRVSWVLLNPATPSVSQTNNTPAAIQLITGPDDIVPPCVIVRPR
ncbi:MAG: FG-GAP repeat protein [Anaerolineales bacterium]|nr:FG-GAP repeat protein [Anaerolineales bacterium]